MPSDLTPRKLAEMFEDVAQELNDSALAAAYEERKALAHARYAKAERVMNIARTLRKMKPSAWLYWIDQGHGHGHRKAEVEPVEGVVGVELFAFGQGEGDDAD